MSEYEKMCALLMSTRGTPAFPLVLKEAFNGLILAEDLKPFLNSGAGVPEAQGTVFSITGRKGGDLVCFDVRYSLTSADRLRHEWWAGGVEQVDILQEVSREW